MNEFIIPETELRQQADKDGMTHLSTGVVVAKEGQVLMVRRAEDDYLGGSFELPGGGIEAGETFAESVTREVLEETGLRVNRIVGMFPGFEYSTPAKPKVRQFNFLVETENSDVRISSEHDSYRWIEQGDIGTLAVTGPMKECLERAFEVLRKQ